MRLTGIALLTAGFFGLGLPALAEEAPPPQAATEAMASAPTPAKTIKIDPRTGCDSCKFQVGSLDQPFRVVGKWLFTRDDDPKNKDLDMDTSSWPVITTPGPWKPAYNDGKNFSVGWYRGVFEFDPSMVGQEVVLLIDTYMARINVYVDGNEVYRRPNNINVERFYSIQPVPVRFKVAQTQQVVAFRVETPLMTGVYELPFEIRKYNAHDVSLAWYQFRGGELRMLAAFIVFFFGLFFLLVFSKTRYSLYLIAALGSISVFPFFVAPSDALLRVFAPEPLLYLHYTGLFTFFFSYIFTQYFYKFKPKTNWVMGAIYGLTMIVIALQTVYPNLDLFQKVRSVNFIVSILIGTMALYQAIRGAIAKRPGALILAIGMSIFFVAGIHDMLLAIGKISSTSMLFSGVLGFTVSMLIVASNIFANTFMENKRLVGDLKVINDNLENIVNERTAQLREKTNDIQAMLQNMPQGILTIVNEKKVHPEYSSYMEQIFETKDIAGKNFMDLVFKKSNVGSDFLSQVDAAIDSCIGEDAMNFEFNSHLFVTDLDETMEDGRIKSLELSWSPISNDQGTCEKLMVCVRDVTEMKKLAAEAGAQKRELEMIGQILAVNQEKFHGFIESSIAFCEENEALIKKTNDKQMDVIGLLFRNMHTIKGNARTFGLLHLTNLVHETEQTYDEMRKNPEAQWDQAHMLEQLHATNEAVEEYSKLNEHKLGRKGPGRRGGVDKFLMVQKDHIQNAIDLLNSVDMNNPSLLGDAVLKVRKSLQLIGTDNIGEILGGVLDSMPSLASELGKEAPKIVIEDHGIVIRSQIADLLKNVFMHLYRNSMDHGLETAEKRTAAGKTAIGTIRLQLELNNGRVLLKLSDDGRGLAVGFIRTKAIENGVITEDQQMTPEAVAQLIFASGFSTAEKVTEVSGRGVGMDAVKGFVEREEGTLELRFLDNSTAEFRPFETVISLPEKFAVQG
jgi:HPt (histidine-containing phosphotransfer) domain-containing protein